MVVKEVMPGSNIPLSTRMPPKRRATLEYSVGGIPIYNAVSEILLYNSMA